ncbi:MAG: hypothetical protein AABY93_03145 [Bacteroidota bacterium]
MKTRIKISYLLAFMISIWLMSCNDDKINFTSNDSENVQNETVSDSYVDDADDISSVALSSDDATLNGKVSSSGRRVFKVIDVAKRLDCAEVSIERDSLATVPTGIITIDFGTGCTDVRGNVRKGIIRIRYNGRRFIANSTVETTFDGYSINDIILEGTRTITNITGSTEEYPKFTIVVTGGKTTWPDGTFATREVNRTREWIRDTNPSQDLWINTGTASGTNRKGYNYSMVITKPLVFKRECSSDRKRKEFIAVEGTKELTVDGKLIVIDYGDGTCDNTITITINGTSKEVEVNGDN